LENNIYQGQSIIVVEVNYIFNRFDKCVTDPLTFVREVQEEAGKQLEEMAAIVEAILNKEVNAYTHSHK